MFIYMTSKVAGQNLIPFFNKWGLSANDATREKIEKLNLPKLEKEIWLSTDSNQFVKNKLSYTKLHMASQIMKKYKI